MKNESKVNKNILIKCRSAELASCSDLIPFQGNLKDLSKENYKKLKEEIISLGFSEPLSVWKNDGKMYLLNGHQRHRTLKKMIEEGYNCPAIPISMIEADSFEEARKKVLALTSQYGEITGQGLYEFAMDSGLTADDIKKRFRFPEIDIDEWRLEFFKDNVENPQCDEDEIPDPPPEPITRHGDIYRLGDHRLMCGDSTDTDSIERLMNGSKSDLWLTDPPYGVGMQAREESSSSWVNKDRVHSSIINDDKPLDEMLLFWKSAATSAYLATSDKSAYYWFACQGGDQMMMMMMMLGEAQWQVKHELIWVKDQMCFGRADYHYKHEPILYGWKKNKTHEWFGDRRQVSIFDIPRPKKSDLHPTMKPIELLERIINNSSLKGHGVLDTFGGSGSTLIACEKTKRKCFMMEIDPIYCDVIVKRWEAFTGKKSELVTTGSDITADSIAVSHG